jgi:heptosyltransferase-3
MSEFKDVKNILVIKLRHIGDVLLTIPVFRALRESFPDARITALVNSGTQDVLSGHPLIDEIIVFERTTKALPLISRLNRELSFMNLVHSKHFDMAVDLTSGDRAAILAVASGARYRLAYDPEGSGFVGKRYLYTHRTHKDGSRHMVLQNLDVVRKFGITTEDLTVDFFVPDDAKEFARNVFKKHSINESDTVIHIHPTSRWLFKCWKDEYMADVINSLLGKGVKVILTSSPAEKEMEKTKRIIWMVDDRARIVDLCGRTTIKQLAAVSERASLFLGVDSAPMHIAAAVNTPVVALFGPTGEAEWGPWGEHTLITKKMRCISCEKGICDGVKVRKCLEAISAEEVIEAIARVLHTKIESRENLPLR